MTPFQTRHADEYSLRVAERNAESRKIVSVSWRFCEIFEKGENLGANRSRTSRFKFFKASLHTYNYKYHLQRHHEANWDEYKSLSVYNRKSLFSVGQNGAQASIHVFMAPGFLPIYLFIDAMIVEIIIGDMLFHPYDIDGVSHIRALVHFKPTLDDSEDYAAMLLLGLSVGTRSVYLIRISSVWLSLTLLLVCRSVSLQRFSMKTRRCSVHLLGIFQTT